MNPSSHTQNATTKMERYTPRMSQVTKQTQAGTAAYILGSKTECAASISQQEKPALRGFNGEPYQIFKEEIISIPCKSVHIKENATIPNSFLEVEQPDTKVTQTSQEWITTNIYYSLFSPLHSGWHRKSCHVRYKK